MSQAIPYKNFKWIETTEGENFQNCYALEVVLEYSKNLHSQHNDLPICPQNKKIKI